MAGKDLGTYHVRVEFVDGQGFLMEWNTSRRYMYGSGSCSPLDAKVIEPVWEDEHDLFESIVYMFTEGNYSCDCNRRAFLARAYQQEEPEGDDDMCGDTMLLKQLTAIRPDGTEEILWVRD